MPKSDNMSRTIQSDLKRFASTFPRYAKGTAKLFLASGTEYFGVQMPAVKGMIETNHDVLVDAIRVLRNPAEAINKSVDRAMQTDGFKELQKFAKNALDDLKSGELYDANRSRSGVAAEIDDMLSDFGGFDMTGFDENGDWSESGLKDLDSDVDVKIAEVQEVNADKRTEATIQAIGTGAVALTQTANANAQATLRMSMKQHSQQMNALQNMITAQSATFELINKGVTAQLDVTREAHNQMMSEMGEIKSLLTEIRDGVAPKRDQPAYKEKDSIYGPHGELDLKKYIKQVIKNVDEMYGVSSSVSMMTGGMDMKTLIELAGDNPWQLVTDQIVSRVVGERRRKAMENTNKNIESFASAYLQKLAARGKKFESGESTDWKDMLAGLFGVTTSSRTSIDTNYQDPAAKANFTSKTTRAIEEVIPMWLARIDSHLTGGPLMVYNYTSGKLEKASSVIAQNEHKAHDLVGRMGDTGYEMVERAGRYNFRSKKEEDDFVKYVYQFLQRQGEQNNFINPYASAEDFKDLMPSTGDMTSRDKYYNLLMGILKTMPRNRLMQMSRDINDARASRDRGNFDLNKSLKDSGLIAAWSGFFDEDLRDKIASATREERYGLSGDQIDKLSKNHRAEIIKRGGPAATNVLLNDILSTLQKGIITYSYNIGQANGNTDLSRIMDDVRDTAVNAKTSQERLIADMKRAEADVAARNDADKKARAARALERAMTPGQSLSGMTVGDDITSDIAETIQALIEVDRNPIKGSTNNPRTENYRKWFDSTIRNYKGKVEDVLSKTGAQKWLALMKGTVDSPLEMFTNGLGLMDAFMFKALFGEDAASGLEQNGEPYLLQTLTKSLQVHFMNAKKWFTDKIGGPLEKYLLDPKEGLVARIGNKIGDILDPYAKKVKDRATETFDKVKGKWIGTKDKDTGQWSGGRFSDTMNRVTARGRDGKTNIQATIGSAINQLLYGDNVLTRGVKLDVDADWDDETGQPIYQYTKVGYSGVIGKLKKSFDDLNNFLFGDEDSKNKFGKVKDAFHEAMPDMVIGGGIGALASIFLPGGPVLGAALGAGAGLVKGSSALQKFLFGEFSDEDEVMTDTKGNVVLDHKTGKPKMRKKQTKKGLLDRTLVDGFKQYVPNMAKGAGIGMIASMFLPGGPVLGGVIGAVGGMATASDKVKDILFGKVDDDDSGIISKNMRKKFVDTIKDKFPGTIAGGALGSLLGAGVGMIPGLALAGPVFTMMGSLAGFANADKVNQFLFGEESEVDEKDEKGNLTGKKVKKREGGIFGGVYDTVRDKIITPVGKKFNDVGQKIGDWFHESVIGPLDHAMKPLQENIKKAGNQILESFQHIGDKISDGLFRAFSHAFGDTDENGNPIEGGLKGFFKTKVLGPLDKFVNKIFSTIGEGLGKIISAPFKLLDFMVTGRTPGDDLDGKGNGVSRWEKGKARRDARYEKRKQKRAARADRHARQTGEIISGYGNSLIGRLRGIFGFGEDETTAIPLGGTVLDDNSILAALGYSADNQYQMNTFREWKDHVRSTGSEYSEAGYRAWAAERRADRKRSNYSASAQAMKDAATQGSVTARDQFAAQNETKEKARAEGNTRADESSTREKNTRRHREKKTNNEWLENISKTTKKIFDEIKGQVNGVGWNTAYIMTLLRKQYGDLDDADLPEEMEGSKRNIKKRRGIFGKAKDFIGDKVGGIIDWGKDKIGKIGGVFDIILNPFRLIGKAAGALKDGLASIGSGLLDILKEVGAAAATVLHGFAEGVGQALAGVGDMIRSAGRGIGEALGNVAGTLTGVFHDVILSISAAGRGLFEIAADIAPDVAHGIWGMIKGAGKGLYGAAKWGIGKVWSGAKGIVKKGAKGVKWVWDKLTGKDSDKDEKSKTTITNLYKLGGGFIDSITDPVGIEIGEKTHRVAFPWVSVVNGIASGFKNHAIPVYILGSDPSAIVRTTTGPVTDNSNSGMPDSNLPALPPGVPDPRLAIEGTVQQERVPLPPIEPPSAKQKALNRLKRLFKRTDSTAESGNAAEVYDNAISNAQSMEDVETIKTVAALNGTIQSNAAPESKSGEKEAAGKAGILSMALQLFSKTKIGSKIMSFFQGAKSVLGVAGSTVAAAAPGVIGAAAAWDRGEKGHAVAYGARGASSGVRTFITKASTSGVGFMQKAGGAVATGVKAVASKLGGLIEKAVNKFLTSSAAKKLLAKFPNVGPKILNFVSSNADKAITTLTKEGAEQLLKKFNIVILVATAVADLASGMYNASQHFDVSDSDVTWGMRAAAGFAKALSGLAFGLIPVDFLAQFLYGIFAGAEAKEKLKENQQKMKETVARFNEKNGTNLSVEEFQKNYNEDGTKKRKWWQKIGDFFTGGPKEETETGKGPGWGKGPVTPMSQRSSKYNKGNNNMALAGCGPTAASMVASAYGKKVSPTTANSMSYSMGMRAPDGGTNPAFYSKFAAANGFGMKQGPVDGGSIGASLQRGQPVVLMGKGGAYGGNMHYLVADGVNGRGGMSLVDPLTGARRNSSIKSVMGNTSNAIYSFGKGPADATNMSTDQAQKALVDKMVWLKDNPIKYSLDWDKQNPDKGAASCASTVGWAYNKALGVSGMSASSLQSSKDSRFTTIFTKTDPNKVVDTSILRPGDVLYFNWPDNQRKGYEKINDPEHMSHTEMYAGNNKDLSHGGPDRGPVYKDLNSYRLNNLMMVRRYTPFMNGQSVRVDASVPVGTSSSSGGEKKQSWVSKFLWGTKNEDGTSNGGLLSGMSNYFSNLFGGTDSDESGEGGIFSRFGNSLRRMFGGNKNQDDVVTSGDGSSGMSTPVPKLSGSEEKQKIWNYLISQGYSKYAAAGLMGCWQEESRNTAHRVEGDYLKSFPGYDTVFGSQTAMDKYTEEKLFPAYEKSNISISKSGYKGADGHWYPGIGLAQWTGTRSYNLAKYAKEHGGNWGDTDIQLGFFQTEANQRGLKDKLNKATSVREGAQLALDNFEMYPGWSTKGSTGKKQWDTRAAHAQQIYDLYGAGPGLFSNYGKGPSYNLSNLNSTIKRLNNNIINARDEGSEQSNTEQITDKITKAIETSVGAGGTSDTTMQVLVKALGQMIEILGDIRDNTAKDKRRGGVDDSPKPPTARGDNFSANPGYVEGADIGAGIVDQLTSK